MLDNHNNERSSTVVHIIPNFFISSNVVGMEKELTFILPKCPSRYSKGLIWINYFNQLIKLKSNLILLFSLKPKKFNFPMFNKDVLKTGKKQVDKLQNFNF